MAEIPPPQPINLTIVKGSTWTQAFDWENSAGVTYPLVSSGYTALLTIGMSFDSPPWFSSSEAVTLSDTFPNISILEDGTSMSTWRPGTYIWKLTLTSSGGLPYIPFFGKITVLGA